MGALEGEIVEKFLNTQILLMAAGSWILLWALRRVWKGMDKIEWVKRLKPVYPLVLCQAFVWIPGILPGESVGDKILMAAFAGFLSGIGYQQVKRILGSKYGVKLPDDPAKLGDNGNGGSSGSGDGEEEEAEEAEKDDDRSTPIETPVPQKFKEALEKKYGAEEGTLDEPSFDEDDE